MGYGIRTVAAYGVSLNPEEADRLAQVFERDLGEDWPNELEVSDEEWVMVAEGSDSRIENTTFNPRCHHIVGFLWQTKVMVPCPVPNLNG